MSLDAAVDLLIGITVVAIAALPMMVLAAEVRGIQRRVREAAKKIEKDDWKRPC